MSFTITQPGTYIVEAGHVYPPIVTDLAVGRDILWPTLLPLILLVAGFVALVGAVVSFVITAVRRRRARRRTANPSDVMSPGQWSPA
jgi:hypothetical protein